jgi:hypothetical protein
MPQKSMPGGGQWMDADAINANADELGAVENQVAAMRQDILRLRSLFMGLAAVVREKVPFEQAELDHHVKEAWAMISAHEGTTTARGAAVPGAAAATITPAASAASPQGKLHTCTKCHRQVAASRITILASGEICDACANT